MARIYEVLFYNGWQDNPAYYLVDSVEGQSPKQALARELPRVIRTVREQFLIPPDVDDHSVCESLYVLRSNGLLAAREVLPAP